MENTGHESNKEWWQVIEKAIDKQYKNICCHGEEINVLDLGCGEGTNIFRLQMINYDAEYFGIDIDDQAIRQAETYRKKYGIKRVTFLKKDIINDAFPEIQFDVVLCSEVMEHLYDNEKIKVMNKINKCLKRGGFLIITTPTPECLFRKIYESDTFFIKKMVDILFKNTYQERILADFSHGRHHHVGVCDSRYYKKLFLRKGFSLIAVKPTAVFQWEMPRIITKSMNFIFIRINPLRLMFSASLVYVCKKEGDILVDY